MTTAGDGPSVGLDPATVGRLWTHASAIASAGSIPARAREEVVEELYGHLVERTLATIASGRTEADAADTAIAAFGAVDELAADLSSAFHSRLWMSTIGVLLPAIMPREDRPGIVGWLRFALGIGIVLTVIGIGITAWRATPGHALVTLAVLALGLGGLVLAFQALARGQR